jgi:hypothetical protein
MSAAVVVIDFVFDEWSAVFEAPPEMQLSALDWLADQREYPQAMITEKLIRIAALPESRWAAEVLKIWKAQAKT